MEKGLALIIAAIIGVLGLYIWADVEESKQWAAFSKSHDCVVVENVPSSTVPVFNMNNGGGMSIAIVPGKKAWRCNDGVTYWR
jgi:hypothetical protein